MQHAPLKGLEGAAVSVGASPVPCLATTIFLHPIQVETWRPRVQGTQLKALAGARLPETEAEFENILRVAQSLQDCLKLESSPQLFMQVTYTGLYRIQQLML